VSLMPWDEPGVTECPRCGGRLLQASKPGQTCTFCGELLPFGGPTPPISAKPVPTCPVCGLGIWDVEPGQPVPRWCSPECRAVAKERRQEKARRRANTAAVDELAKRLGCSKVWIRSAMGVMRLIPVWTPEGPRLSLHAVELLTAAWNLERAPKGERPT
jgi:predicted nucleic acid-binding Zn ribbon protein